MGQAAATSGHTVALRGTLLDFVDDPFYVPEAEAVRYIPDGLLVVEDGYIAAAGPFAELAATYGNRPIVDYSGHLITPGLIDTHIHYPQTEMMAAYGEQLLEWLNRYTFPTERQFQDGAYARRVAEFFWMSCSKMGRLRPWCLRRCFPNRWMPFLRQRRRATCG